MSLDGRPLLLDFNLSVDGRLPAPRLGGTLPYMAPEELRGVLREETPGRAPHFDPRSDVFSLGVILYELLGGSLPFGSIAWDRSAEDVARQLLDRQTEGPQRLEARNPQIDHRLARLVESCLAFDPEERPQTASELAGALRGELGLTRRSRRWVRTHRRFVSVAGAVVLAMILAGLIYLDARPPYPVRQFERGLAYSEQGEHDLALDCLFEAIRYRPNYRDAIAARARIYKQLGKFDHALRDYSALYRLTLRPEYVASEGYCYSRMGSPDSAIRRYQEALNAGYSNPALLNNLGRDCYQKARVDEAEVYLARALQESPRLHAAHLTMTVVMLNRLSNNKPVMQKALFHARMAAETGPLTSDVCLWVAGVYAEAAKEDPVWIKPALEYVEKTVEQGYDLDLVQRTPPFRILANEPRFKELLSRPPLGKKPTKSKVLLDPFEEG